MSEELNNQVDLVKNKFENFSNFIELPDFRSFLLFTLTSQVPMNVLAQMGLGGSKEIINLPYNPIMKIYYQKINLISAGSLIVYVKSDPISEKFILEKDDPTIKSFLNPNEMSLAFRGKEKFLLPKISDCNNCYVDNNSKITIKIDDLFHSLESFLAVAEPNLLFVIDGNSDSDPDILFTFNMMPEIPGRTDKKILKIDVFIDSKHITREVTYIKREEDYKIEYLKEVKEVSHAEIYKSSFSLIVHVKSLNEP
ncbi:MAG: hypothetical protein KGD65_14210 [Candidatus Lokiarchaeota archaeon]|nr:hypothetical protein [Candidatus Lokiarchaeota archaeon]